MSPFTATHSWWYGVRTAVVSPVADPYLIPDEA
jgi:hypothetical protein